MKLLEGKVAIVTGAGSGIGRAGAQCMAEAGAAVVVADINESAGQEVVRQIEQTGGRAQFIVLDVRESQSVQRMVGQTIKALGQIDVLYHNAANLPVINHEDRRATELSEETWDKIVGVVLRGTFLCVKYVGQQMLRQRSGSIILTSTVDALIGVGGFDAYTAAKGGVVSLTRSLAAGLGPEGVRVNSIAPGFVATPHQMEFLDIPQERAKIESMHVLPIAEPRDVAEFAVFLASDKARNMTGGIYPVDGGYSAVKAGMWLQQTLRPEQT